MAGAAQNGKGPITGINITPMVDVMLVLLVILMVSANWVVQKHIRIDLPKAKSGEAAAGPAAPPSTVTVTKEGQLHFGADPVTSAQLAQRLAQLAKKDAETTLVVSADKEAGHGKVVEVLDIARNAGLRRFAVTVEAAR